MSAQMVNRIAMDIEHFEKLFGEKVMFSRVFRKHGQLCASRPWEVIIGTITFTACVLSIGWFANFNQKICGWNYVCEEVQDDLKSSDLLILTITRCLAVMYIYLQFTNLRKLGSKYLLGIAGVFTIFSSFVFSIVVINLVGSDLTGLNEALPFFLLLVDLSKASALAKFALSSTSQDEVVDNISRGMAVIGPTLTLDAVVETLVIGVGTLSGVRQLETMCCFGCLSVIANYVAFMTFYPSALALVLEMSRERNQGRPLWQLSDVTKVLEEDDEAKPNPVTQRVKVIMSGGLVFIHIYKRWMAAAGGLHGSGAAEQYPGLHLGAVQPPGGDSGYITPTTSLWMFYFQRATTLSLDYTVTICLTVMLMIKYIFYDTEGGGSLLAGAGGTRVAPATISVNGRETPVTQSEAGVISRQQQRQRERTLSSSMEENGHVNGHVTQQNGAVVSVDWRTLAEELVQQDGLKPPTPPSASPQSSRRRSRQQGVSFSIGDSSASASASEDEGEGRRRTGGKTMVSQAVQATEGAEETNSPANPEAPPRSLEVCAALLTSDPAALTDAELLMLVDAKTLPAYRLEAALADHTRGVSIRRQLVSRSLENKDALNKLPYTNYDYSYVSGACCENVLGYLPVPLGVAGPLLLDDRHYHVPMATTEGCLVASTNRGCRAFMQSSGVRSSLINNGMTRAPVVRFHSAPEASRAKLWLEDSDNFDLVAEGFNTTSRFARLQKVQVIQVSKELHIRFKATTGDAMGMNMLSKGSEKALAVLQEHFPDMLILSLSGNMCTDKKPSALNWIEGRGKSVVCEATIPQKVVQTVLKTSTAALVDLNISKNLVGSAMAGSIGGFNAHAANIVTAIYIATGQDPAQNVCSSNCITLMEAVGDSHQDLYISCTMPSIECGTVGGGTVLPPQAAALEMLGVRGSHAEQPGENAARLARVVCATVMAAELSLMSALAAGHLVQSHLRHNRSVLNMAQVPPTAPPANPFKIVDSPATRPSSLDSSNGRLKSGSKEKEPGTCINKSS